MPEIEPISLTPAARRAAVRDLGAGEHLRISFAGGCGAPGFRLAAARWTAEDDLVLEREGVSLVLDRQAARELLGAVLDWSEDEGFVLDHERWGVSC